MPKIAKIEKYEAKDGFRWRFRAPNGRIMADSGEAYSSKQALDKAIKQFIVYINGGYETKLEIGWADTPTKADQGVETRIFNLLRDQLAPGDGFTLGWKLVDDCGADSLDFVETIMALEDEFGIEIPDEDSEKFVTGQDIVEYVQERS